MYRWRTGTGPIPGWVHDAADRDVLYYDEFYLLRREFDDPVRIDWGDTLVLTERGRIKVERR